MAPDLVIMFLPVVMVGAAVGALALSDWWGGDEP